MTDALSWLPACAPRPDFRGPIEAAENPWPAAMVLAGQKLDFLRTHQLDAILQRALGGNQPTDLAGRPVRLAILASCTTAQLHPALRVAFLRRNLHVTLQEAEYGQYWQALAEDGGALETFAPTVVLLALDAHHLAAGITAAMTEAAAAAALAERLGRIRACWRLARQKFGAGVIQQMPLPVHPALLGSHEHRLPGSKAGFIARLARELRAMADAEGVDVLALDDRAARDGLAVWHDPGLWHRAKQEIFPAAAPRYGELVARLVAARMGLAKKCLVLDLDNTLWGGVIGDDGLEGIVLGQGSALGEAFAAFQDFCRELSRRGVILAVCSKNDEANALEAFEKHPEMVLRRENIACFVANWSDKAANLRAIAEELSIGLDSLVFVDDNPFERDLVRRELPMVAVPEVGDDPTFFAGMIADAGYFEALDVTEEDRQRSGQYQGNRLRAALRETATDLPAYLRSLEMRLLWRGLDALGFPRTLQLINKTNQFNLTTKRYTEAELRAVMDDPRCFALQLRLLDRFGDNGVIGVVIGRLANRAAPLAEDFTEAELGVAGDLHLDTWLMSCRVLGRGVEPAMLALVAAQARRLGARRLIGRYVPSQKNAMVRDHYAGLGFTVTARDAAGGSLAVLALDGFVPAETFIDVREG